MAKKSQVVAAEAQSAEPDETEQLRQELDVMRGRLSSTESALRDERVGRQRAELATMSAQEQRIVAEQESCESSLSALSGQADNIEGQIALLSDEPGHGAEVAKLNRQMARVEAQILEETRRKGFLADQREKAKVQPQPQESGDRKLANNISTANFSPETRAWLEKHPQAFTDLPYCKRIIALALNAVDVEGIPVDTPEYFAYLEEKTGERQPARRAAVQDEDEGEEVASVESPYSRTAPPVASSEGDEIDYTPRQPQPRAAGPGSIAAAAPPSRTIMNAKTPTGQKRAPALTPEQRSVANELYANDPSCKTEGDRLVKYANGMKFMNEYRPSHFGAN